MEQQNFPYDAIYKAFFSEKRLVSSLFEDFIKYPFVEEINFATLDAFQADYATPSFCRFASDHVWRVQMKDRECFLFIMFEFQSRAEKWMAARIATYSALLLARLIQLGKGLDNGLPPVFPVVLYNGAAKWHASKTMSQLFMPLPPQLRSYQPEQKYFLLDIRHLAANVVKAAHGEASYLIRLERSKSTRETRLILKEIIDKFHGNEYARFRRLLRNFVLCCLQRGKWNDDIETPMPMEEFVELYDNYPLWVKAPWEDGKKEGIIEGKKEGIIEGKKEGIIEGKKEGKAEVFGKQIAALIRKLSERFGTVPESWASLLGCLKEPSQIIELTIAACTVGTSAEFESELVRLANA